MLLIRSFKTNARTSCEHLLAGTRGYARVGIDLLRREHLRKEPLMKTGMWIFLSCLHLYPTPETWNGGSASIGFAPEGNALITSGLRVTEVRDATPITNGRGAH